MAVKLSDNLQFSGSKPDFVRQEYATLADLKAVLPAKMPAMYFGYCIETHKYYVFDKTNESDPITGLWREFTGGSGETIQVTLLPEASSLYEGKCLQYIGETTAEYTHGYFYDCVSSEDPENPGSLVWAWESVSTGSATVATITTADIDALFN